MQDLIVLIYVVAGPLFLISIAAHIYVRLRLKPGRDFDLDDYHYEFEDQHPQMASYEKWLRITYIGAIVSILLLFLTVAL